MLRLVVGSEGSGAANPKGELSTVPPKGPGCGNRWELT